MEGKALEWGKAAAEVASLFGYFTLRSPTMKTAIERGVEYVTLDHRAREIVFDGRALIVGLLLAGQGTSLSINYGNTAVWFRDWLEQRLGEPLEHTLGAIAPTSWADVAQALEEEHRIVLSRSVEGLISRAARAAQLTIHRKEFEARHVFIAALESGMVAEQVMSIFSVSLPESDVLSLRDSFVQSVMQAPEPGETDEGWRRVFTTSQTGELDPVFLSDAVGDADLLGTGRDARALAKLLCLDGAAPLALAVLGDWGSGKSTFMQRLDREVRRIAPPDGPAQSDEAVPPGGARFVRRIVQIRFNAWQFVDADLWASLTAEFFEQLRAGGWDRVEGARQERLMEQVNRHVHALSTDVDVKRAAMAESGRELLRAERERDRASRKAKAAGSHALGQATLDLLGNLYEAHKPELSALGYAVTGADASRAIDVLLETARRSNTIADQAAATWRLLSRASHQTKLTLLVLLIAAVASIGWLASGANLVNLLASIVSAGALCVALRPAIAFVADVTRKTSEVARSISQAEADAANKLLRAEVVVREAFKEAAALAAEAEAATKRLARYGDPGARSNASRLLRYILEDDPDTQKLSANLGLIGRTRRLFQAVDAIIAEARRSPSADGQAGEHVPDRIILYIDDLDRCGEEQVYDVLQAVHLLLAFSSFVVVVGVDVGRIQSALSPRFGQGSAASSGGDLAARYLEKIFQLAFWLAPLEEQDGGTFGAYVRGLSGITESTPTPQIANSSGGASGGSGMRSGGEETARETRAAGTISLDPLEVDFLITREIAAMAGRTPRSVKRLMNIYRLLKVRLSEDGTEVLGEDGQLPLYPIVAFAAALATGRPASVADQVFRALKALAPSESLNQTPLLSPAQPSSGGDLTGGDPTIAPALTRVIAARSGRLRAGELLRLVQLARRYGFNGGPS